MSARASRDGATQTAPVNEALSNPLAFARLALCTLKLAGPTLLRLAIPGYRGALTAQDLAPIHSADFHTTILSDGAMMLRHLQRHEVIEYRQQLIHVQQAGFYRLLKGQRAWTRFESIEQAQSAVEMAARSMSLEQRAYALSTRLLGPYLTRCRSMVDSPPETESDSEFASSSPLDLNG